MGKRQFFTNRQLVSIWVCAGPVACAMAQNAVSATTSYPTILVQGKVSEFRQFEKVEITGSSIVRKEQTQALPVQVITRQDIQRRGEESLTEVVQGLTAVFNGLDGTQIGSNQGAMSTAALHGMPNGTLVLLNGKRLAPYAIQTISGKERSSVDLGLVPLSSVERIEVLTDGASTLYGTDAIAGVINIITRTEFNGTEIHVNHGRPRAGAGQGHVVSLNWGLGQMRRDGFSFRLSAEMDQYEALRTADRPGAAQGRVGFEQGGKAYEADSLKLMEYSSPAWLYSPRTTRKAYSGLFMDGACVQGSWSYRNFPGGCRQSLLPTYDIYPERASHKLHWTGEKLLNANATVYAEFLYGKQKEQLAINDWPMISGRVMSTPGSVGYTEMIENGMDPNFGFYYWQPDLRALRQSFDKSQMRALIGLRGELANWDYQANIFQSRSQVKQIHERENYNNLGIFNTGLSSPLMDERLLRPLDANNSLTGQLLNQRFWEPQVTGQTTLTTSEVRASRPWFEIEGKDVMIGWGLEIRREQVASMVNPDLSAATFPPPSFQGTRRNAAAYAEAQIPVKPDWDVIAAIRSDHYNDVGPSHNGKLATRWRINSRWALRSSIGTGFRAPSIGQVQVVAEPFRNGQTNLKACTEAMEARTRQLVSSTGLPVLCPSNGPASLFTNGNPDLRPEKSTQATLGLAFAPTRNMSVSADYWRVEMRDTLQFESLSAVLADPVAYAAAYVVNPEVRVRNFGTERFHWLGFYLQMQNLGASVKEGVDVDLRYRIPFNSGRLMVGAQATYMITSKEKTNPQAAWSSDLAAYSSITEMVTPRVRGRLMFNWETVHTNWQLNANYNSGYRDKSVRAYNTTDSKFETVEGRRVGSYLTWDLYGGHQVSQSTRLRFGITNITDRKPPLSFYSPTTAVWGVNSQNNSLIRREKNSTGSNV